jgi:hypothetical protein
VPQVTVAPNRAAAWRHHLELAVLGLLASAPVLATAGRAFGYWRPVGDTAAITLRASDVLGTNSPLVGMPTTLSDTVGQVVHHPGPLEFWVIAAGQLVSGHRLVPMLAVVAVNLAAILSAVAVAGWLAGRHGRLVAALALVTCTWSLRGDYLIDPYNPYAAWLPLAAFAVALVGLLGGRLWALPIAAVAGSYAAQSHVSLLVPVTVTSLVVLALAVTHLWSRSGGVAEATAVVRRGVAEHRRPLVAGALALAICWLPVVIDLLVGQRNLLTLVRATSSDGPVLGLSRAWQVVARAVTSPPWLVADRSPFETVAPVSGVRQLAAVVVLAGAAALAVGLWRRRSVAVWAIAVGGAGLAGGMTAASRIPGGIFAAYALHNYMWLWPFTAMLWVGMLVGAGASITGLARAHAVARRLVPLWHGRVPVALASVVVAVAAVGVVQAPVRPSVLAGRHADATGALGDQLDALFSQGDRVEVEIEAELDQSAVAMGLVLELERRGIVALVEPHLGGSFGDHRVTDGQVDDRLVVVIGRTGPPEAPRSGLELVAAHAPGSARVIELARANAAIEARITEAGGLVVGSEGRHLDPDDASVLVRSGDLVGLGRLGLISSPAIPADEFARYADAQEGPILHVGVYR